MAPAPTWPGAPHVRAVLERRTGAFGRTDVLVNNGPSQVRRSDMEVLIAGGGGLQGRDLVSTLQDREERNRSAIVTAGR